MRIFRISEHDLDAECREIRPEGELDVSVADRLQVRLEAAVADDVEVLVCLDDCDFIDSIGIAVIVLAYKLLEGKGRCLFVCHPSPEVRRVLDITDLTGQGIVSRAPTRSWRSGSGGLPAAPSGRARPLEEDSRHSD